MFIGRDCTKTGVILKIRNVTVLFWLISCFVKWLGFTRGSPVKGSVNQDTAGQRAGICLECSRSHTGLRRNGCLLCRWGSVFSETRGAQGDFPSTRWWVCWNQLTIDRLTEEKAYKCIDLTRTGEAYQVWRVKERPDGWSVSILFINEI